MIARGSRLPRRLALLACAHLSSATELPSFRLAPPATASLGAALQSAVAAFATAEVPEAEDSAQHLLARAAGFGSSRSALTMQLDAPLSEPARSCFEQMCSQRLARQPVQYILGDWDFHELTLQLRAPVLIPRPETEQLVEMVLAAHGDNPALRLLDVGCGSGAIGLALLNKLPKARCSLLLTYCSHHLLLAQLAPLTTQLAPLTTQLAPLTTRTTHCPRPLVSPLTSGKRRWR